MTGWFVEATHGPGTFRQDFTSLLAAWLWSHGMAAQGYQASEPRPVGPVRHLQVIEGGRGETLDAFAAPAARRNGIA